MQELDVCTVVALLEIQFCVRQNLFWGDLNAKPHQEAFGPSDGHLVTEYPFTFEPYAGMTLTLVYIVSTRSINQLSLSGNRVILHAICIA